MSEFVSTSPNSKSFHPERKKEMTSSSLSSLPESFDVIDFVVNQQNGVKGLVDAGITAVPPNYIQPPHERIPAAAKAVSDSSVPVIDFSKWDDPATEDAIFEAAVNWGFFQIVNHGIPGEVMEDLKRAVHRVFDLPVAEKRKFQVDYPAETVRLTTSFSPNSERILQWLDNLTLHFVSPDQATASWPPQCRNEGVEYMKRSQTVIRKLLQILLKRLNVTEIDTKELQNELMGCMRLNFNYYPKCPNPELTSGVDRHSDISTITILLQDDVGGLFVRDQSGTGWVHVAPIHGALVVNIGDSLQIMSNGLYKSVEHRAIADKAKSRISVPIFVNPGQDAVIEPLPQVLEFFGQKPIYKPVLFSDYFNYFFSKPLDGKSTIDFLRI